MGLLLEGSTYWQYRQSTGELFYGKDLIYRQGYSGKGTHKNDPDKEASVGMGPIPRGEYQISSPITSAQTGAYVLPLTPVGHNAHGRTAFQIHGDSTSDPGKASSGCIILPRKIREKIWAEGANFIEVVR